MAFEWSAMGLSCFWLDLTSLSGMYCRYSGSNLFPCQFRYISHFLICQRSIIEGAVQPQLAPSVCMIVAAALKLLLIESD